MVFELKVLHISQTSESYRLISQRDEKDIFQFVIWGERRKELLVNNEKIDMVLSLSGVTVVEFMFMQVGIPFLLVVRRYL